jgi:imidazolonepropionase-like amidohydrolase
MRNLSLPNSRWVLAWIACLMMTVSACQKTLVAPPSETPPSQTEADRGDDRPIGPPLLFRGARVMTAAGTILERGDVLVRGSKIAAVAEHIRPPENAVVIDASTKVITPGIIDTHSHLGVYPAPGFAAHSDGNEMVAPTTPHVRSADGYWPQDPQIQRARAGGVTTMQILPGSANLIGGRSFTVKTYPRALSAEQARFDRAPYGLKIACGENPKRVYGEKGGPHTRMGNMAGFRGAFQLAREYQLKWARYQQQLQKDASGADDHSSDDDDEDDEDGSQDDSPPEPPARDLGLETLVDVLEGRVLVHNHCYRADEMLAMLALAEEFGFEIRSFHHAVEAYKIADQLAAHGTAASMWADWWGFKAEAFDGIRENAAMVAAAGARAIIHSDSSIGIQRLNQEAAKAMYSGIRANLRVDENEALRWITANPAWALGIDRWVGTLEPGKHADLVVWSLNPFSVYAKAEQVYIEGRLVFDHRQSPADSSDFELGYRDADYRAVGGEP